MKVIVVGSLVLALANGCGASSRSAGDSRASTSGGADADIHTQLPADIPTATDSGPIHLDADLTAQRDSGADTTDLGGPGPAEDCSRWCAYRKTVHALDGFCTPTWPGLTEGGCHDACAKALTLWPAASVQACIEEDPLCFIELGTCAASPRPDASS